MIARFNVRAVYAGGAAAVLSLAGCASLAPGGGAAAPPPASVVWTPDSQPAVFSGRAGWPIMPVDPSIYVDNEGYHLFYSTFFCHGAHGLEYSWDPTHPTTCSMAHPVTAITYAFSGDHGRTWQFRHTPVIVPGDSGFDAGRIETAAVFRLGDTLYAAYSADGDRNGRPLTGRYQIGLARLPLHGQSVRDALLVEGRQFERRAAPLLPFDARPGRFDNNVQEPSVVIAPEGILLYYLGLGLRQPDQPIGVPGQGITSIGVGRAVLDRQLNVVSRSAAPILLGVNMPEVSYIAGRYYLFGTTLGGGGGAHRGEAISLSTSADGVRWSPPRVIVAPGTTPGLDDWGLMGPTAAVEHNDLLLFYTEFGVARHACVMAGPGGRFGIPQPGDSACVFVTIGRAVGAGRQ